MRRAALTLATAVIPVLAACGAPPPSAAPPPQTAAPASSDAADPSLPTTSSPGTTPPEFDIVIRPIGTMDPAALAAFSSAEQRWESIITADVPDVTPAPSFEGCLGAGPTGVIDDLVIDVRVAPIDGDGGILGSAGPCRVGSMDGLPRAGLVNLDSDDVASMLASGTFLPVVLHEMGHVLGIGTRWPHAGLLTGAGGADPRYVGVGGLAVWTGMGGSGSVPVEDTGGSGTRDAHWRESTFDTELMTGWIDAGPTPLSALTISSLGDLGYQVDLDRADPYTPLAGLAGLAGAMRAASAQATALDGSEILVTPTGSF